MKILLYILPFLTFAQVGINTTDPQAMLDVNGDLIVRDVQPMATDKVLVWDETTGLVGYGTVDSGITAFTSVTEVASGPVDYVANLGIFRVNVALGLAVTVTVAPNSTNILKVSYYVPSGLVTTNTQARGYLGTTFFRDGNIVETANAKISIPGIYTGHGPNGFEMGYLTNSYYETINNNTAASVSHTYEVQGYIEQYHLEIATATYRFNMWSATGDNYNWGKGNIRYELIRF